MCAVSAVHKETGDVPYFWFALHRAQIEFLEVAHTEANDEATAETSAPTPVEMPTATFSR